MTAAATWAAVRGFVDELRGEEIPCDVNLDDVPVPGVWVQLRTVGPYTLAAELVELRLVCLVEDLQADQAYPKLLDLFERLDQVLPVSLDGTFVTVRHPEGDELPGLAIPYQLVP